MRSIQALSWLDTVKLYNGAPITTISEAKNSPRTDVLSLTPQHSLA